MSNQSLSSSSDQSLQNQTELKNDTQTGMNQQETTISDQNKNSNQSDIQNNKINEQVDKKTSLLIQKTQSTNKTNNSSVIHRSVSGGGLISMNASLFANSSSKITNKSTRKEEFQLFCEKCMKGISHSINIIKAVMMRLVFSFHSLIAIIYVYFVKQDEWYFVNIVGVIFLLIELFITIIRRKGKEPRWFFPCFFIYICTMIPPIWFVELARIEIANENRKSNSTNLNPLESIVVLTEHLGIDDNPLLSNAKNLPQLDITTATVFLEISLLMFIILGRWFLPKGNISRSTLSQLLLVYMSLASDIVDLLSLLNETQVQESSTMAYFTLAIFSWSLFQFSLNLVVTRGRSFQSATVEEFDEEMNEYTEEENDSKTFVEKLNKIAFSGKSGINFNELKKKKLLCINTANFRIDLLDSEIWSILITLIFQDGPFLALRLTAVIKFNVRTYATMFFTCKNAIILFLQFYRLSAICTEANNNQADSLASNKADALSSLNSVSTYLDKFVLLSYKQNLIMKRNKNNKNSQTNLQEAEKKLMGINPILIRSTLSRYHSYAVVLTPNYNLSVACCDCDCHIKETQTI